MIRSLLILVALVAAKVCGAQRVPNANRGVLVTEDSIGDLGLWAPLGLLRQRRPDARDTVRYGESTTYPAVVFPFKGVLVLASQYADSIDLLQPADAWVVQGAARLPGDVPLSSSLSDLQRAFGRAIGFDDLGWTVMFCSHPRFFFEMDVSDPRPETLSDMAGGTTVASVTILPVRPAGWHC